MAVTAGPMPEAPPPGEEASAPATCAHCGLPAPDAVGDGPHFCCTGCAVVYEALRGAGLADTYYRLREQDDAVPQPAAAARDAFHDAEFDAPPYIEEHTTLRDDGTRATELFLDGVHCTACLWLVERLPFEVEGVAEARLDLPRARLTVAYDPDAVKLSAVATWLRRFGYSPHPVRTAQQTARTEEERRLLIRTGITWALAANVMLLAFALYSGLGVGTDVGLATAARWASLALAVPAVLYGGSVFFRRAWASMQMAWRLRDPRALHIDTPIALGVLVGFGHSAWATVTGQGEVWFDSVTVLIAALLTARWIQLRSRRLAGDATERLLALIPSMARRVEADGSIVPVRAEDLREGDLVEVPAGEVVPVDGEVVDGTSALNKAVLTGESRPVAVAPGALVEAGAMNQTAPLRVRVRAAGEATRVGRLLAWIRSQDAGRAPITLLADRLSGYFVLAVLLLAAMTAAVWYALDAGAMAQHVVALLVISCPCALGMAMPLALSVAAGRAARAGIFIKTEAATEELDRLDTVVLDKTGTLTDGVMTLVATEGAGDAVRLAAAVEQGSNHPIAGALLRAATDDAACPVLPSVTDFEAVAGSGVRGVVEGRRVQVGTLAWVEASTLRATPQPLRNAHHAYVAAGHTPVAVAVDGRVTAVLALGDRLRPDSPALIAALQERGLAVYLLSGDHPRVVHDVARRLGIEPAHARGHCAPEDKHALVDQLRAEGHVVAMVGDGVNDAAALQAANVGIAVQGGTSASLVAADLFLVRPGVRPVLDVIDGSSQAMRLVRRLLVFTAGYNFVGATAAMAGLVTPLVAAVAMPLSSLAVVLAAVLQQTFKVGTSGSPAAPQRPVPPVVRATPARTPAARPVRAHASEA